MGTRGRKRRILIISAIVVLIAICSSWGIIVAQTGTDPVTLVFSRVDAEQVLLAEGSGVRGSGAEVVIRNRTDALAFSAGLPPEKAAKLTNRDFGREALLAFVDTTGCSWPSNLALLSRGEAGYRLQVTVHDDGTNCVRAYVMLAVFALPVAKVPDGVRLEVTGLR